MSNLYKIKFDIQFKYNNSDLRLVQTHSIILNIIDELLDLQYIQDQIFKKVFNEIPIDDNITGFKISKINSINRYLINK